MCLLVIVCVCVCVCVCVWYVFVERLLRVFGATVGCLWGVTVMSLWGGCAVFVKCLLCIFGVFGV